MENHAPDLSTSEFDFSKILREWRENKVNINLLQAAFNFPLSKCHFSSESYSYTRRMTVTDLLHSTAINLRNEQEKYKNSVTGLLNNFLLNYQYCLRADDILGADETVKSIPDDSSESESVIAKDGSHKLSCPMQHCTAKTFKIRRHLEDVHKFLSRDQMEFATKMAKLLEKNKKCEGQKEATSSTCNPRVLLKKAPKRLELVQRRLNHKKCLLCGSLQKNMTSHLKKDHKLTNNDPNYSNLVRNAPVIPKCYIKKENGKQVELAGEELEEAKKMNEINVESQKCEIEERKKIREDIHSTREKINNAENEEQYVTLRDSLVLIQKKYNNLVYKDNRNYSAVLKEYKDSYVRVLTSRKKKNPERIVRMAVDCILSYEAVHGDITIKSITNSKEIRKMLILFRDKKISNSSKIKYIEQFKLFMLFLLKDIDSPIRRDEDDNLELMRNGFKYEEIKNEINSEIEILNKMKGRDMMAIKLKAKKKLLTEGELNDIMSKLHKHILEVNDDMKKGLHLNYSKREIASVRNSLITIGAVRIARRSLELAKMTLHEVEEAEEILIDETKYYQVNVMHNKNAHNGKSAPVVYHNLEFDVLKKFIRDLRPKISSNRFCEVVFPSFSKINSKLDEELSLSGVLSVLNRIPIDSERKLSTRIVRGSTITINRDKDLSETTLNHIARSMGHDKKTADDFYDFTSSSVSVRKVLSGRKHRDGVGIFNVGASTSQTRCTEEGGIETSCRKILKFTGEDEIAGETVEDEIAGETVEDEIAGETEEDEIAGETEEDEIAGETEEDEIAGETEEDEIAGETEEEVIAGKTEEDVIGKGNEENSSQVGAVSSIDMGNSRRLSTALNFSGFSCIDENSASNHVKLRNRVRNEQTDAEKNLKSKISSLMTSFKQRNVAHRLFTSKGRISVAEIMKLLPSDLVSKFTIKKIRSLMKEELDM